MTAWPQPAWWRAVEQVRMAVDCDLADRWQREAAQRLGVPVARADVSRLLSAEAWAERLCLLSLDGDLSRHDRKTLYLIVLRLVPSRRDSRLEAVLSSLAGLDPCRSDLSSPVRGVLAALASFASELRPCLSGDDDPATVQVALGRASDALGHLTRSAFLLPPVFAHGFCRLVEGYADTLTAVRQEMEKRVRLRCEELEIRLRDVRRWSAMIAAALEISTCVSAKQLPEIPEHSLAWALEDFRRVHRDRGLVYQPSKRRLCRQRGRRPPSPPSAMSPPRPKRRDIMYVRLRLQLRRTSEGLEVLAEGPAGQARAIVAMPTLPGRLPPGDGDLEAVGGHLFQSLFRDGVAAALAAARHEARGPGDRVALQLRFDPEAVEEASYPWELLHDGYQFLLFQNVDLTRYVSFPRAVVPVTVDPPLRVLVAAPSPRGLPPLDLQAALRALRGQPAEDALAEDLAPPTFDNLLTRLAPHRGPVHAFDFEGHGAHQDGRPGLCFETAGGDVHFVDASALGTALSGSGIAFVLINACYSADPARKTLFNSLAPQLILAGVPAVIGMQGTIGDEAANRFLRELYENLCRCVPVARAVAAARRFLFESGEWYKPVLFLRGADESGRILVDGRRLAALQEPPPGAAAVPQVEPFRLLTSLRSGFGKHDFDVLCFQFDVDPEDLPGEVLIVKMKSLIEHHRQRGTYPELVREVLKQRPHLRSALLAES